MVKNTKGELVRWQDCSPRTRKRERMRAKRAAMSEEERAYERSTARVRADILRGRIEIPGPTEIYSHGRKVTIIRRVPRAWLSSPPDYIDAELVAEWAAKYGVQ